MSSFSDSNFVKKLADLNNSQQSIQTLSLWLIHHRKHAKTIVKVWNRELHKAVSHRKLTFLYLANDAIQNSKKKGPELRTAFGEVLPGAVSHTVSDTDEKTHQSINRLVKIWDERQSLQKDVVQQLRFALGHLPAITEISWKLANAVQHGVDTVQLSDKLYKLLDLKSRHSVQSPTDVDKMSMSILPYDIGQDLLPMKTLSDGNCLYNSVSLVYAGDYSLSRPLRMLTAAELCENSTYYATHPKFQQASENPGALSTSTYFVMSLSTQTTGNSDTNKVESEARLTVKDKMWSCYIHLLALCSVLRRPVFSVYPNLPKCERLRHLLHGLIEPRGRETGQCLYIMWTRKGSLEKDRVFVPNHFVPLIPKTVSRAMLKHLQSESEPVPAKKVKLEEVLSLQEGPQDSLTDEPRDPPDADELVKLLSELEHSASSDAAIREKIAALPQEVSDVSQLEKIKDKESANKLTASVDDACLMLDQYNRRLATELDERKTLAVMLKDFIVCQKEQLSLSEKKLEEYKEKLNKVNTVREQLESHIKNLPDLTRLPEITGGLAPLPSAGDLFSA